MPIKDSPTRQKLAGIGTMAEAMKELIEMSPKYAHDGIAFDCGELCERLFKEGGYELQLHQHGIQGTTILAVKLE